MAVCSLGSALRAAPLVAHQRRTALAAVPAARRTLAVRAQKEESKDVAAPAQQQQQERAVGPARSSGYGTLDTLTPSWGRMNQMFHEMEREMNQLSRAFGMPSLGMPSLGMPSLFTDLPSIAAAADMPATSAARALAMDIKDTDSELQITADVPGLTKDDIKVQVSPDRVLSISGERRSEHKEGSKEAGNLRIERSYGSFLRRFRLPENVDVEGIKANTKDGVLRLTVPKTEAAKPKQIDIQVSE